jgi:exopolyphosphatase/guanosine-5'-triphosphate,3'-diphosphate pyrophosphatase
VIVPRWEWRTFGDDLGDADRRFDADTPEREQESDELYLLSTRSDASVKVRGGQMDVKLLEQVDDAGLEQWRPVMKASFPLEAGDVRRVLDALQVESPDLARTAYTLDQLVAEVIEPDPALRAVAVHKRRAHYTVGDAMAERSELRTEQGSAKTAAIESEHAARVRDAVDELGLAERPNVNMASGLRTLTGLGARRDAVLDVGTNSVKFHLAECHADGSWHTIDDRSEITRLGEGLDDSGELGEEPMRRTSDAIAAMVEEARLNGVEGIAAVGTAGLRMASNSRSFLDEVRRRTGIEIEVIPGEEEARLAYVAAISSLGLGGGSLAVFDTGGGSSQFTFGHDTEVEEQFSVNVGAARFTERFGLDHAVDDGDLAEARDAIAGELDRLDGRPAPDTLVGLGGAVTNLAAVSHELARYDPDVIQGTELETSEIDRQIELYRTRDAGGRREITGLQPKRAEVILAGALIVRTVCDKLGQESLTVSDRGLRHGLLVERFGS